MSAFEATPPPAQPPLDAGVIHLTFDDGPDPLWTPAVLAALSRARVKATFFVMTTKVRRHPHLVEAIRRGGHTLGLHCHEHHRHTALTADEIAADTDTALAILAEHDLRPGLWRLPWGIASPDTAQVAADRGLTLVPWTADTEDWRGGHAGEMLARVVPHLEDGAIVLAHDGIGPGATRHSCGQTVAVIDPLVRRARGRGLDVVAMRDQVPA